MKGTELEKGKWNEVREEQREQPSWLICAETLTDTKMHTEIGRNLRSFKAVE